MGIYQGAGQGYPDAGMGMRAGFQAGYPSGLNPDLPFFRGQSLPDYGGYQVLFRIKQVVGYTFSFILFLQRCLTDGRKGYGPSSISYQATVSPTTAGGLPLHSLSHLMPTSNTIPIHLSSRLMT